jgi:Tfp pilus assembly protein PilN
MRAVNLLPKDDSQNGKRPPLPVLVGCGGLVVVAAVLALLFMSASSQVGQQKSALAAAQASYAAIPSPPSAPAVDGQLPNEHQSRVNALATALGQRLPWDRLLREVSQVVPSDVWLTSLNVVAPTITAPTTAAGALPQEFVVDGCTYSQDSVARFLARLDVVPDLTRVTLGKAESGASAGSPGTTSTAVSGACPTGMVSFTLNGDLNTAASS